MNRVTAVYETTLEMLRLFEEWTATKIDREELISKIGPLVETREQFLASLHEPYSTEEMLLGQKMIQLNDILETKMSRLFEAVKTDIKKVKQKKELNYSYINPYGDIKTTDGMYVDNKL